MEAAGKSEGEGKKLDIIYFLSRMGHIEHPHLIRVQHLNRNGVYLRDVKRWLADLRGKEMPETFSWSYKRRYKSGYIWQDLMDGDLISPVSNNEYVLKGSQLIPNNNITFDATWYFQKRATADQPIQEQASMDHAPASNPSPQVHKQSPQHGSKRSTLTEDDSISMEREQLITSKETSHLLNNDNFSSSSKSKSPPCTKSKSNSSGASQILRNLLTCGAVDTNDAVLVVLNRATKGTNNAEICKGDKLGGSPTASTHQQHQPAWDSNSNKDNKEARSGSPKVVSAAYRPVGEPSCSQCGKPFKPEKLHSHMKSCKGMKTSAKTSAAFVRKTPVNSCNQQSATGYFLTN